LASRSLCAHSAEAQDGKLKANNSQNGLQYDSQFQPGEPIRKIEERSIVN
jgi:hypothetical protein